MDVPVVALEVDSDHEMASENGSILQNILVVSLQQRHDGLATRLSGRAVCCPISANLTFDHAYSNAPNTKGPDRVSSVGGVSGLLQTIPGTNAPAQNPLDNTGFGPDFIVQIGQNANADVPGFSQAAGYTALGLQFLSQQANEPLQPVPIYSEKQAEEYNAMINDAATELAVGNYEAATEKTKALLSRDPNDPIGYHLLGRISAEQDDYDTALGFFERASELAPTNATFQEDVFNTRLLRKDAQDVLDNGKGLVSNPSTALQGVNLLFELTDRGENLGQVYLAIAEGFGNLDLPVLQMNAFEVAMETGTTGDLIELEKEIKQFITENEPVGLAYSILGRTQQRLGKFDEALESLETASEIAPETTRYISEQANVHASIGNIALSNGDIDTAKYRFNAAHEMDLLNDDITFGLAAVLVESADRYLDVGLDNLARSDLNRANSLLEDDPGLDSAMAKVYVRLADRAMQDDLKNLALLDYEKALEADPEYPGLARKVADLNRTLAEEIKADNPDGLSTTEHENVVAHYEAAYELFSYRSSFKLDYAEALNDFGLKLMNDNSDYDRALEMFDLARDLYPDNDTYEANWQQAWNLKNGVS